MVKRCAFLFIFLVFFWSANLRALVEGFDFTQATQPPVRVIDTATQEFINKIQNDTEKNLLLAFAKNPKSNTVRNFLSEKRFKLKTDELIEALATLSPYQGVLALAFITGYEDLEDRLDELQLDRHNIGEALEPAHYDLSIAHALFKKATKLLHDSVTPALEKITAIHEKLTDGGAKVIFELFGPLKPTHAKVMSEEMKLAEYDKKIVAAMQAVFAELHAPEEPEPAEEQENVASVVEQQD